jgi:adenosylcobinamide kinase / adenosylcobinamide-phosphate guanylyltransferase
MDSRLTFIIGGARSGKSRRAQSLAEAMRGELLYIATAQAFDEEMAQRIIRHQGERCDRWSTVESPLDLSGTIDREARPGRILLIDCLTLWTSNVLLADMDGAIATDDLVVRLTQPACPVIIVSNEVGLGIVPDNALARAFRDVAGRLHQKVAELADRVELMVAGLPLQLK